MSSLKKLIKKQLKITKRKNEQIAKEAYPIVKQVYETSSHLYKYSCPN